MKPDEMALSDGRKLTDVWPKAAKRSGDGVTIGFVSIPAGHKGKVFVEHGDGSNRMISLYVFRTNGESDFVEGRLIGSPDDESNS